MIPRIVHQVWHPVAGTPMPPEWVRFAASWRQHHPGFQYRLWEPQQSLAFVAQHHPGFLPAYQAISHPMQRAEALHILLLHHFGGLCAGLDVECLRNVEPLLAGSRLVLAAAPGQQVPGQPPAVSTAFIASEPGHPFWEGAMAELRCGGDAAAPLLSRCLAQWASRLQANQHQADHPQTRHPQGNQRQADHPQANHQHADNPRDRTPWHGSAGITVHPPQTFPASEPAGSGLGAHGIEAWARATAPAYAVRHGTGNGYPTGAAAPPALRPYHAGMPLRLKHPALARVRPGQLFTQGPMVSCIMVSRGSSHPARWSIQCFRNQSYTQRELLVATAHAGGDLQQHIAELQDPRIRFVGVLPPGTPSGNLCNAAVDQAAGTHLCLWHEDDLSGADRLAAGMTALLTTGTTAAFLERTGLWRPAQGQLQVSARPALLRTLLARRDALPGLLGTGTGAADEAQAADAWVAAHPVALVDDPNLYLQVAWRTDDDENRGPSGTHACGNDAPAREWQHPAAQPSLSAEGPACEPLLSVLDKHYPVAEYLQWLRQHDPGRFAAAPAGASSPAAASPVSASPAASPAQSSPALAPEVPAPPRTVMMAWELGGGLGHMVPLSQVARPLLEAGHTVHMVLADLSGVPAALGTLADHPRLQLWQAPHWPSPLFGSADPASYAELLFRAGYLDAQRLAGLVQGWATLLDQLNPDLLLVDHAPTALLAARGRPLRRAQFGTGFFIPLMEAPIPSYREWEPVPRARVERSESLVLQTCNALLFQRGQPLLDHLHQLFECDETFLITVPELDHFERRGRAAQQPYWGSLASASHGQAPQWPDGSGPALFVYLKSDYRALGEVLKALREIRAAGGAQPGPGGAMKPGPWRVLAYIPGLNAATVAAASGPGLRIMVDPLDMQAVCRDCDAVLCQSGSGTVATALHAGKPVLMLPMHMEQLLFARRVQALGAGLYLTEDRIAQLPALLQRLAAQPGFGDAARAFARRHARPAGNRVAQAIAARCEQLMHGTHTPPATPGTQAPVAAAPAAALVPAAP
jgi:hypothetical protein